MKKLFVTITLLLVLLVGNLFAYDFRIIKKSGGITYLWDLDATKPNAPSSKELNNWISEMEELGFECTVNEVIPLSKVLGKKNTLIDEVLLARSHGCYTMGAVDENDLSCVYFFVSKKDIFIIAFETTIWR